MSKKETETKIKAVDATPTKKEGEFKIKSAKKMKDLSKQDDQELHKVVITKKEQEKYAIPDGETKEIPVGKSSGDSEKVVEEIRVETTEDASQEQEVDSPIQEITDEKSNIDESGVAGSDETTNTVSEQKEIPKEVETQKLPENIEKLVQFMKETGGDVHDYSRLNADYSNVNDEVLLHEFYKKSKPHLNGEERGFIIEDSFRFDEELDDARDIRMKKLAYKEEVAKAKNFLEDLKGKYYEEIKLRPGVTKDQKEATDFFSRYQEEQKVNKVKHETFVTKSKELLNNDFKGFDFNVGDKKFRYNIKDPVSVADNQSNISNFIGKFLNKKGEVIKHKEYHKALYTAQNADNLAQHFYEQGKTDAIKTQLASSKNISTEPRKTADGNIFVNGLRVKAITGLDSSKLKIKRKTFN